MEPCIAMRDANIRWLVEASEYRHLFQHRWLGERFFHLPGDMVALQEIVQDTQAKTIIQTGVAAGGGPVFFASILSLVHGDAEDWRVLSIEPHLRESGVEAIRGSRFAERIEIINTQPYSSEAKDTIENALKGNTDPVLVVLDLIHTQEHVLAELRALSTFVTPGSFAVVLDTVMEYMPAPMFEGRDYGPGNNPATAVDAFLSETSDFELDYTYENKVLMTLAPGGFLRRR